MMDLTQLFHASVKTARIRSKALGLDNDQAKNIFPREKRVCEFSKRAKGLVRLSGYAFFPYYFLQLTLVDKCNCKTIVTLIYK